VKFSLKSSLKGFEQLTQALRGIKGNSYAKAGLLGANNARDDSTAGNVEIGLVHEFGSEVNNIPARPFVSAAFKKNLPAYKETLREYVRAIYAGKMTPAKALGLIGLRMAADMKLYVTEGPHIPPPLQPETVARKGSDRPLVDTGRMVDSIAHEVVLGGRSQSE